MKESMLAVIIQFVFLRSNGFINAFSMISKTWEEGGERKSIKQNGTQTKNSRKIIFAVIYLHSAWYLVMNDMVNIGNI